MKIENKDIQTNTEYSKEWGASLNYKSSNPHSINNTDKEHEQDLNNNNDEIQEKEYQVSLAKFKSNYNESKALVNNNNHTYSKGKDFNVKKHPNLRLITLNGKNALIYPSYKIDSGDGKIQSSIASGQLIYENGFKQSYKGISGSFYPIGCEANELDKYKKIYMAEGIATGDKIYDSLPDEEKIPVLCYFSKGFLKNCLEMITNVHPLIEVIIAVDMDGYENATEAVAKLNNNKNVSITKPEFSNEDVKRFRGKIRINKSPSDFWDVWKIKGKEAVLEQIQDLSILVKEFFFKDGYLYYLSDRDDEYKVFTRIDIIGYVRDEKSSNWKSIIKLKRRDGKVCEEKIAMEDLCGDSRELFKPLYNKGFWQTNDCQHKLVINYLKGANVSRDKLRLEVSKVGWNTYNDKDYYILPNYIIPSTAKIYWNQASGKNTGFGISGDLEGWQENIEKYCKGNSRLILALAAAFTAPLLPLFRTTGYGFNLRGSSSGGKTTALHVASSVWGGNKFSKGWNTTANALEVLAEQRNHNLLCLDELGKFQGSNIGSTFYALAEGGGKERLNKDSTLKDNRTWQTLILSTGELSASDKVEEYGKQQARAGMEMRLVNIPSDPEPGGKLRLFDTVHEFNSGHELSVYLNESCNEYYGIAGIEFLNILNNELAENMKCGLSELKKHSKDRFFKNYVNIDASGQVKRVAEYFCELLVGLLLAIEFEVVKYISKEEAVERLGQCFMDHVESRGGDKGQEDAALIERVKKYLISNHESKYPIFTENADNDKIHHNVAGYREEIEGVWHFYTFSHAYQEMLGGMSESEANRILNKAGILIPAKNRAQKEKHFPSMGKSYYYDLTLNIEN